MLIPTPDLQIKMPNPLSPLATLRATDWAKSG
jgi:hypothetical protein